MSRTSHRQPLSAISWFLVSLVGTTGIWGSSVAFAKSSATSAPVTPLPHATTVATVVVDNPQQPAAAAPAAPVAVAPAPAPVVQQEAPHKEVVHADANHSSNYMSTVALSALMGGVAGALVGGAVYFIDGDQPARNVAYWAAGGVLVGTAVGVTQVMVQESRVNRAVTLMPSDPAPTFRLALWQSRF